MPLGVTGGCSPGFFRLRAFSLVIVLILETTRRVVPGCDFRPVFLKPSSRAYANRWRSSHSKNGVFSCFFTVFYWNLTVLGHTLFPYYYFGTPRGIGNTFPRYKKHRFGQTSPSFLPDFQTSVNGQNGVFPEPGRARGNVPWPETGSWQYFQ